MARPSTSQAAPGQAAAPSTAAAVVAAAAGVVEAASEAAEDGEQARKQHKAILRRYFRDRDALFDGLHRCFVKHPGCNVFLAFSSEHGRSQGLWGESRGPLLNDEETWKLGWHKFKDLIVEGQQRLAAGKLDISHPQRQRNKRKRKWMHHPGPFVNFFWDPEVRARLKADLHSRDEDDSVPNMAKAAGEAWGKLSEDEQAKYGPPDPDTVPQEFLYGREDLYGEGEEQQAYEAELAGFEAEGIVGMCPVRTACI